LEISDQNKSLLYLQTPLCLLRDILNTEETSDVWHLGCKEGFDKDISNIWKKKA